MGPIVVRCTLTPSALSLAGGKTELNARFADRLTGFVAALAAPYTVTQLPEGVTLEHVSAAGLTITLLHESAAADGRGATYLLLGAEPDLVRAQLGLEADEPTLPELVRDLVREWPEVAHWESQDFSERARTERLVRSALDIVVRERRASTSYLQRRLQISYRMALQVLERLEAEGVISPPDGAGKRTVLIPPP